MEILHLAGELARRGRCPMRYLYSHTAQQMTTLEVLPFLDRILHYISMARITSSSESKYPFQHLSAQTGCSGTSHIPSLANSWLARVFRWPTIRVIFRECLPITKWTCSGKMAQA